MTAQNNGLLINGEWRHRSDATIDVVSPSTEKVVATVPDATDHDVLGAVAAARRAFDEGAWRRTPLAERAAVLEHALAVLDTRVGDIADLVTAQMGLPTQIARKKTPGALWAGRETLRIAREQPRHEVRQTMWGPAAVLREPVGVVAAITPWNSPFNMAVSKIVPALVSGCSVVFKPSEETPLDAYAIAEALVEAGVPAGVFNLLTGGRGTGQALVAQPGVDKVSFTGSTAAGRHIARVAGERFARVQLELGGKSAAIVLDDADPQTVLQGLAAGTFANTGQVCSAYTRILVPREACRQWIDVAVDAARSFTVGDPFDEATTMGPLVSAGQRDRVLGYIDAGRAEGARIVTGGGVPAGLDRGYYVDPTVFADADNSMRISREEIFGPVAVVIPYTSVDEAIEIANDSSYGLHGAVFTRDADRAVSVAEQVRTGTFSINAYIHNVQAPFGGVKDSGVGREMGPEGLDAFYELKTVNLGDTDPAALNR